MPQEPRETPDTITLQHTEPKVKKPRLYKVLLHNDDYTPMDFVVHVLESIFHKNHAEAVYVMLSVHRKGLGLAGVYTHEIAEAKMQKVVALARRHEHPLKCTMEPE